MRSLDSARLQGGQPVWLYFFVLVCLSFHFSYLCGRSPSPSLCTNLEWACGTDEQLMINEPQKAACPPTSSLKLSLLFLWPRKKTKRLFYDLEVWMLKLFRQRSATCQPFIVNQQEPLIPGILTSLNTTDTKKTRRCNSVTVTGIKN